MIAITGVPITQIGVINADTATDGQVLTADGAGGAAWEAAGVQNRAIGPRQLANGFTRVSTTVAANLDGYTTIDFGQRRVLRFAVPNHRGTAVVTINYLGIATVNMVGGIIGGLNFQVASINPSSGTVQITAIAFEDYTKAVRGVNHWTLLETGGVNGGETYADGSGLLFGYYSDNTGPFVPAPGKGRIESVWLVENELHIAINSAATSDGPFTLQGDLWIVY